ncbi:hypothetical protein L2E82_06989 [Cichorium intybus]|uniref:Uncharacterized protein n=1 Tax=Cichorium intybus TaxID=13427 RepID=A0ACB9G462_CICIN|nr:hypothetical protein L2E82_06989 [Cichorium intybus]
MKRTGCQMKTSDTIMTGGGSYSQNWDRGFVFINGANSLAFLRLYDIHDKIICIHCQKSGEEEEEADVMPNESTKDCVDEEDIGGFAGSWGHHSSPNTVPDTIFQASIGDEISFPSTFHSISLTSLRVSESERNDAKFDSTVVIYFSPVP